MVDLTQVDVKSIIDLGTSGMLLIFLWIVWRRLNMVTDVLIDVKKRIAEIQAKPDRNDLPAP